MRFDPQDPPRVFEVGLSCTFRMRDCGRMYLAPDEQITFVTESGAEYDLPRKDFGFYATPSTNSRLRQFGLRTVLIRNRLNRFFVLLVERGKEASFEEYVSLEQLTVIAWLDDEETVARIEACLSQGSRE